MKIPFQDIESDINGFDNLIKLHEQTKNCISEVIEIDFSNVNWFAANMCAPFGAILYKVSRGLNSVLITNIQNSVKKILSKNDFLSNYGYEKEIDTYNTTIQYKRFEPYDSNFFGSYVENFWIRDKGIPEMTPGVSKKLKESVFEIFNNCMVHSQTKFGIFSCGQYFYHKNKLDFSIADLGIGIRNNVEQSMNLDLTSEEAIEWALEGINTTKKGNIPGGLGLKLLKEFIKMNKGSMQIISDNGYWGFFNGKVIKQSFSNAFPGTVVNIEINTADKSSYHLAKEINQTDVF